MFLDDADVVDVIRGITLSNSCMDYWGGVFFVLSLTDSCFISVSLIPNNKSRINQNGQLLCGMAATGEIFRFGGILVLISFYFMTVAKPYWTFSGFLFWYWKLISLFLMRRGGLGWVMLGCMRLSTLGCSVQDIPFWRSLQEISLKGEVERGWWVSWVELVVWNYLKYGEGMRL